MNRVIRPAIYVRSAIHGNGKIHYQIGGAMGFASRMGWVIANDNIYSDIGSGFDFLNRPGLSRLLDRVKFYDVVIMSDLSRIGRDSERTSFVVSTLLDNGKRICYYLTNEEEKADAGAEDIMRRLRRYSSDIEREERSYL